MKSLYATSVSNVPQDYNDPTAGYKRHVWIAVVGILAFFAFYLFLTYWFFTSAYRLLTDAFSGDNSSFLTVGVGVASLFLGIFMIKAFFFVQTKYDVQDRLAKPEEEPVLFDYLHKLADEIGAPRPSKVYLSNRVNASVFYDLSFLNLFFPSKKNLEIGLGLINVLNLGEFKAVLAHEYGHFAQKSMLVGRWVYIANQIANTIITRRDALDSLLNGLSRIDLRVAWIGWILSIIVWSIRSLVELIFRIVVLSQRALSREMEFQADLVSVSVTGSDALIHALHKLQAADAALSEAMNALGRQLDKGKAPEDLYAIQSHAIEKTAYILNDDEYGKSPKLPDENPEDHRVFTDNIAQPPKMWLTHPPDQEREANAKLRYIFGHIDDRNAWDLFHEPQKIRLEMTKELIESTKIEANLISTEDALSVFNKKFDKSYFKPSYRGVYLNRFFCMEFDDSGEMYLSNLTMTEAENVSPKLYPDSLVAELEDFMTLKEEMAQLEAIKDKRLTASGEGGIWHRGTQIRRRELPTVINGVKLEMDEARHRVTDHDKLVRTTHLRLAEHIGQGWDEYLKGLLSIIHYSEHNMSNIQDAQRILGHVLTVVMADNKVSSSELRTVIHASNDLHDALSDVAKDQEKIILDEPLIKELGLKNEESLFEKFVLPLANDQNINDWINAIENWIGSYIHSLTRLRSEALELLLRSEEKVQQMYRSQEVEKAASPSFINTDYNILPSGHERESKLKLNYWDKFISAEGFFPSLAKFAVAASIVGGTVFLAGTTISSKLSIYNGLGQTVLVNLNGAEVKVYPHSYKNTELKKADNYDITTTTINGQQIESFQPTLKSASSNYVYNVAGGASLYEYRVYYGGTPKDHNVFHGNDRWTTSQADYIFEEAPESFKSSSGSMTKDVLVGVSDANVGTILSTIPDKSQQMEVIRAHILWDPASDPNSLQWVSSVTMLDDGISILRQRLESNPDDIITLRTLMKKGGEVEKNKICDEYNAKTLDEPSNANAYYIAARCLPEGIEKEQRYLDGIKKWSNHSWMNYAASYHYIRLNNWKKAHDAFMMAYHEAQGLKPVIGLNAQRIFRLLKSQNKSMDKVPRLESSFLDYYEKLEAGIERDATYQIHFSILKGELQKAMDLIEDAPQMRLNTLATCAASDGAKVEWIDAAIQLSPDSLSDLGLISVLGLRLRRNLDVTSYSDKLQQRIEQEELSIPDFINNIRSGNYTEGEQIMNQAAISIHGQLCALAYVAYGNKTPKDWRLRAQALLFASEKPYMLGF